MESNYTAVIVHSRYRVPIHRWSECLRSAIGLVSALWAP